MPPKFLERVFGNSNDREIARLQKIVQTINALEPEFQALNEAQLRAKTNEFRRRYHDGETLEELLPEAFAAVREASRRTIGLRHYDVQLIGGMILHDGKVAEMRTGEGKTLVATLPLYLNALTGQGAHLVTPNDYLAKFGVQWMGPVYHALGMSVSVIQSGQGVPDEASFRYDPTYVSEDDRLQNLRPITRREAYQSDITYGTNNEFGFDYLRDNMVISLSQCAQGNLAYAIVDEVDSILIDEARTPLIISGPAEESSELYKRFAGLVPLLHEGADYEVDLRTQVVLLTEAGVAKVEQLLNIPAGESLYDAQHAHMLPYLDNALRAKEFYQLDKEYVIREGEVIIVDAFTGRLMFGRRYSEGLHQAIEAKEHVPIQRESLTYATITFQNFFRMYHKLAGMTGTAETEKEELRSIYNLDVVVLPTNVEYRARFEELQEREVPATASGVAFAGILPEDAGDKIKVTVYDDTDGTRYFRRLDLPDQIYKSETAKFRAVVQEIKAAHTAGRPVLVGTTAIETSERLSKMLRAAGIRHEVLNAKYHEREATIIAQAGQPGTVTIATNMAGRGVDILLGGNPEGMAREQLRREEIDLTQIPPAEWDAALRLARRGEDPTPQFPTHWAQVLYEKVQQCAADRKEIYAAGGLHVIGTERHEARRIDNQLRGRAGRQGDPGSSRFYISLEDELMRRFGGERLQPWMERAGMEDAPLEFNVLGKVIASVQERVEGYNFDVRKHVLEYDDVVNKQREVVYAERRKILSREDLKDNLLEMVEAEIRRVVTAATAGDEEDWDLKGLLAELRRFMPLPRDFTVEAMARLKPDALIAQLHTSAAQTYEQMHQQLGAELYHAMRQDEVTIGRILDTREPFHEDVAARLRAQWGAETVEELREVPLRRLTAEQETQVQAIVTEARRLASDRQLMLRALDTAWIRHLTDLDILREGIGLRAVGQQRPLVAYQKEAFEMYQEMLASVQQEIVRHLFLMPAPAAARAAAGRRPSPAALTPAAKRPVLRTSGGSTQAPLSPQISRRPGTRELGRNDPCWCGSGKKYKNCHFQEDQQKGLKRYVSQKPASEHARAASSK
ncbi:MAG TPA: preprotein translocase subunit SecA [Anaerolineae bacterium]|nr:preprotein translocase subunit SecA [Anaerolineae bacterium]